MDTTVQEFLRNHRVSVFSLIQDDGTVHAASLHFAHSDNPFAMYVWTGKNSRKCRPLLSGKTVPAAVVIGFDEAEFATFQADGTVTMLTEAADLDAGWTAYGAKYPDRAGGKGDTSMVLLRFTPTWWRYTDLKTKPTTVISSEA